MSRWAYVNGIVSVRLIDKNRNDLVNILNDLPVVSGSETDMNSYIVKCLKTQNIYILAVEGNLRDREYEQTYHEFRNWLFELAKEVKVDDILVEIRGEWGDGTIIRNMNDICNEVIEDVKGQGTGYKGGNNEY